MNCPYCNSVVVKEDSEIIYGRSYGDVYICSAYPACNAYVGADKKTGKPLGTLADYKLRRARNKAHASFDPLWQKGGMKRTEAYKWMAEVMDLPREKAHIAMFDVDQCNKLIGKVMRRGKEDTKEQAEFDFKEE